MVIYIIVVMVIFIILVPVIRIIQPIIIITIIILVIVLVIILIQVIVILILILNYKIIDNNLEYHHQCMGYLYHLLNLKQIINKIELDLIEDIIHHIKHDIYIYNR